MNVDTAEFAAIQEQARDDTAAIVNAFRIGFEAGLRRGRGGILAAPAGRHAAPRRDRRGLRLVAGGDART